MSNIPTLEQQLIAKGWVMYHQCNTCSGIRQYFTHNEKPGFEVRVRVKKQTFSILSKNHVIAGSFWGYMLEDKLKQFVP